MGFRSGSTDRFWEAELQTKLVRECRVHAGCQLWVGKVAHPGVPCGRRQMVILWGEGSGGCLWERGWAVIRRLLCTVARRQEKEGYCIGYSRRAKAAWYVGFSMNCPLIYSHCSWQLFSWCEGPFLLHIAQLRVPTSSFLSPPLSLLFSSLQEKFCRLKLFWFALLFQFHKEGHYLGEVWRRNWEPSCWKHISMQGPVSWAVIHSLLLINPNQRFWTLWLFQGPKIIACML